MNRHLRTQEALTALEEHLSDAGIAAVLLKGATLYRMGIYAAGERPMADLDLLVREQDLERASQLLQGMGFTESLRSWRERTFTASSQAPAATLGEHSDHGIKVELHTRICEKLPWHITDITELIFPASPQPGLNGYRCLPSLMAHLLLHAAGGVARRTLRLLQLHDLALLCVRMSHEDWLELLAVHANGVGAWWALPPLVLTDRYYGHAIPEHVLADLAPLCHRLLRRASRYQRLSDVSHSRLWIDAFPGLEWSRSVREMLEYILSRVRPSEDTLAFREDTARTAGWADGSQWSRLPQYRRVLRWLTSRPTRPPTMHAVRAALRSAADL
jgi:hypothetical protein